MILPLLAAVLLRTPSPEAEWISASPHLIAAARQGWGVLGLDTCAHLEGREALPLQIGTSRFARGLGSHAPGEIVVDLDGRYDWFEAVVGVQWQQGATGSVVFRVYVDGRKRFDSGTLRESDPPRAVRVRVRGAQELRLVAGDAGDGITCDCANWAEARLTPSADARARPVEPAMDIAPFATVASWDPERKDGTRAGRTQEFPAQDVYLETPLRADVRGLYTLRARGAQRACIGLEWIERRRIREAALPFRAPAPPLADAALEAWVGGTRWQGRWIPVRSPLRREEHRWAVVIDPRLDPECLAGVRKIRWIMPASPAPWRVGRPIARTSTRSAVVRLILQRIPGRPQRPVSAALYNGEVVGAAGTARHAVLWPPGNRQLRLEVRRLRAERHPGDRTVLRFRAGSRGIAVAVDDVLASGQVVLPDFGLEVRQAGRRVLPAAPGLTVLQRVRRLPDQTLQRALQRTHRPIQDSGPMLLSLARDCQKFVVHRDGAVEWDVFSQPAASAPPDPLAGAARLQVGFRAGGSNAVQTARRLDRDWVPAHETAFRAGSVDFRQTAFVVPVEARAAQGEPARSVCVVEVAMRSRAATEQAAEAVLVLASHARSGRPATMEAHASGILALDGDRLVALVAPGSAGFRLEKEGAGLIARAAVPWGGIRTFRILIPGWPASRSDAGALAEAVDWRCRLDSYWRAEMEGAAGVTLPDKRLENVIRASQVHCLMAARSEAGGTRIAPWIASMAYGPLESEAHSVIRGMDVWGHGEFARRSLDFFLHRVADDGVLTTGYTLLGTGWHLWTLGEHHSLHHDDAWLRQAAPAVARACEWTVRQRRKTMRPGREDDPLWGLAPPGVLADWNAYAAYYMLNAYYCAGLREASVALARIRHPRAAVWSREAADYRACILRSFRRVHSVMPAVRLQSGRWVAPAPTQVHCGGPTGLLFPGEDANRSWCYDVELGAHQLAAAGILDARGLETASILDHLEDVQFLQDGWLDYPGAESRRCWFDLGGFAKVQPYYARNAEILALRDDVRPFLRCFFNALASLLNTETLSLWEHFHAGGAWNKTHETGYFLYQARQILVMERGNALWLAPFVSDQWTRHGSLIEVRNAPTRFGPVAYRITSQAARGRILADIEPPVRQPPAVISVRLRHPEGRRMRRVTVNGRRHRDFDPVREVVHIVARPGPLRVIAEF